MVQQSIMAVKLKEDCEHKLTCKSKLSGGWSQYVKLNHEMSRLAKIKYHFADHLPSHESGV
jgi:hypothetical protein